MTQPTSDPLVELAALVRTALQRADALGLASVAIDLDAALVKLSQVAPPGTVVLEPFSIDRRGIDER